MGKFIRLESRHHIDRNCVFVSENQPKGQGTNILGSNHANFVLHNDLHSLLKSSILIIFLVCGSRARNSPGTVGRQEVGGAGEVYSPLLSADLSDMSPTFCYFTCFSLLLVPIFLNVNE